METAESMQTCVRRSCGVQVVRPDRQKTAGSGPGFLEPPKKGEHEEHFSESADPGHDGLVLTDIRTERTKPGKSHEWLEKREAACNL